MAKNEDVKKGVIFLPVKKMKLTLNISSVRVFLKIWLAIRPLMSVSAT
ncbi:hypothetical protein Q757_04700 [Oenococcus alcoholitolerans]|uniref:Uncharacterized protein n=1 Tax=Oenococcus alcoholitolerans TaxID=931074 RepID=A0ABR4XQT2_9LACO|nr:hypothetical protein Q757_04700 [Oenococcus alcoholitolerans]